MSEIKNAEPKYEAPVAIPLGDRSKGVGQACHSGGSASNCQTGATASNNCNIGQAASSRCGDGVTAGRCSAGGTTA